MSESLPQTEDSLPGEPAGPLYTWWRDDPLVELPALPGLAIELARELDLLAELSGLPVGEVQARVDAGHRPYLARLDGVPVAYGWVATRRASIGALGISFSVPPGNRYLWDFVTLPRWRGRGIYPRLLQAILRREVEADRFWIGHDVPNVASARGILKAGFTRVGEIYWLPDGSLAMAAVSSLERARAGAALLGIRLLQANR